MLLSLLKQRNITQRLNQRIDLMETRIPEKVRSVIILIDDLSRESIIYNSLTPLFSMNCEIQTVIFKQKLKSDSPLQNIFSPSDFDFKGNVKSENLKKIISKEYDLLIDYSEGSSVYHKMLISLAHATFRIAFSHMEETMYNLLIQCKPEELTTFNNEFIKYLKLFKVNIK